MVKALKSTGIVIMIAQNTYTNLMYGVWALEFYCTPLLCTIIGSTTNTAKCGKTPANGVKAPENGIKSPGNGIKSPGNGVKSPGNADESWEFPGLLC